ncbi:hypothetical protein EBM89_12755 [Cellulomonas triticagri]|uniref:Uncharacterized protein n=1 Tax=Cellulomonas triticagri TaxID=2483352 RepID=A0A3M2JBE9_9CELL|nr:hypothetical protein EBM89_12755 [Cellulomonas triticagri]
MTGPEVVSVAVPTPLGAHHGVRCVRVCGSEVLQAGMRRRRVGARLEMHPVDHGDSLRKESAWAA